MLLLSISIVHAGPQCEDSVDGAEFSALLDSMAMGFAERNLDKLVMQLEESQEKLPCLEDVLSSEVAHQFHLLNGLFYAISNEDLKARQSLSSAKSIDPAKTIPEYLFPKGHHMHALLEEIEPADRNGAALEIPQGQQWFFDGIPATVRPKDAPAIFQVKLEDGRVVHSEYLGPFSRIDAPSVAVEPSVPDADTSALALQEKSQWWKDGRLWWGSAMALSTVASYATVNAFETDPQRSTYVLNQFTVASLIISSSMLSVQMVKNAAQKKHGQEG